MLFEVTLFKAMIHVCQYIMISTTCTLQASLCRMAGLSVEIMVINAIVAILIWSERSPLLISVQVGNCAQ